MTNLMIPRTIRMAPLQAASDLRSFDRLFHDLWRGFGLAPARGEPGGFTPVVELRKTETEYQLRAELPGLEEKDFEVTVEDQVLTLRGEKRSEHQGEKDGVHYSETRSGSFQRQVALPDDVDPEQVKAVFHNGVLTVSFPVPEPARNAARTIPVTTA